MMPAVAVVGFAPRGKGYFPVPLPLVLLWPLIGLGLATTASIERVTKGGPTPTVSSLEAAMVAFCRLRGLEIDLRSARGQRVRIRVY